MHDRQDTFRRRTVFARSSLPQAPGGRPAKPTTAGRRQVGPAEAITALVHEASRSMALHGRLLEDARSLAGNMLPDGTQVRLWRNVAMDCLEQAGHRGDEQGADAQQLAVAKAVTFGALAEAVRQGFVDTETAYRTISPLTRADGVRPAEQRSKIHAAAANAVAELLNGLGMGGRDLAL